MSVRKIVRLGKIILGTYFKKPISGPYSVYLGITDHCNYRCVFCKYDHFQKNFINDPKRILPFHIVKQCIQDLGKIGTQHIIFLSWGEPFTHPNFFKILEEIRRNGMTMGITTNGYKLSKKILDELINLRLNELGVSLNATTGDIYKKLHLNRSAKTFERIKDSLLYLKNEKRKRGISYPILSISFVITTINYKEIENMVSLTKQLGGKKIKFDNVRIYSPEQEYLKLNRFQLEEVSNKFNQLKDDNSLKFSFNNFKTSAHCGASNIRERILPDNCYAGNVGVTGINPDGNVVLCCGCGIPVGNIYEKTFIDIWQGSLMQRYREEGMQMWKKRKAIFGDCCHNCNDIGIYNRIHRIFHFWKRPKRNYASYK